MVLHSPSGLLLAKLVYNFFLFALQIRKIYREEKATPQKREEGSIVQHQVKAKYYCGPEKFIDFEE